MWVLLYIIKCFSAKVNTAYKTLWLHADGRYISNDMHISIAIAISAADGINGQVDAVPGPLRDGFLRAGFLSLNRSRLLRQGIAGI